MTNLTRAREAFSRWADGYAAERTDDDRYERHNSEAGKALLEALHACGVDCLPARSLWRNRDTGRVIELLCMADDGLDFIAVLKMDGGNAFIPRARFLSRFEPLAGEHR